MNIVRPKFINVPLADGLHWRAGADWRFELKLDGMFTVRPFGKSVLIGEAMRSGEFYAFDIVVADGDDVRKQPLRARLAALGALSHSFTADMRLVPSGSGGEFLEAVLRSGGEGVVAKQLSAPFGVCWFKCKRIETHDCTVAEIHPHKQSVRLEMDGADCGWLTMRRLVAVGSVVEVACHSRHPSGKFREPRFVRVRHDKQGAEL